MATNLRSTIVGVFTDRAMAEQAVQALKDAGFDHEQIWYSSPAGASSFFENIKSLFTGIDPVSGNLVNELTGMGLSDEEARYYANEYSGGRSVVADAVRAPAIPDGFSEDHEAPRPLLALLDHAGGMLRPAHDTY